MLTFINLYFQAAWEEFLNFIGHRAGFLHWCIFLLALAACFFLGKRMRRKMFWPSVLVLILFFNPVFYACVGMRALYGVYWRLLWMLPIPFVIAYVLTEGTFRIRKNVLRAMAVVLACACIIVTGTRMFSHATYQEKENDYEIPQAAIEVADIMMAHLTTWKETAVVPNELLCYIRQYSCSIGLLYGRNAEGYINGISEEELAVFDEMSREDPDVELVTRIAAERDCRYIVFNTSFHRIPEDLSAYGYEKKYVAADVYAIYERIGG